jgi:hypothetical protein
MPLLQLRSAPFIKKFKLDNSNGNSTLLYFCSTRQHKVQQEAEKVKVQWEILGKFQRKKTQ